LFNIFYADFAGEGEMFGEEMYEAVASKQGEEESMSSMNGENGFDSPVENKSSPSAIPR